MGFIKLPSNSKKLLDDIIQSENPTQLLCKRFENISYKEDEELRSLIRELRLAGYIDVKWADNKPYHVIINNSARTYHEQFTECEKGEAMQKEIIYNIGTVNDQSVRIGDGNKISNSNVAGKIENHSCDGEVESKKLFHEKHPIFFGVIMSLTTGIILMFSF